MQKHVIILSIVFLVALFMTGLHYMGTISTLSAQLQKTKYNMAGNTQEEESIEESLKQVTDPADVSHGDRY